MKFEEARIAARERGCAFTSRWLAIHRAGPGEEFVAIFTAALGFNGRRGCFQVCGVMLVTEIDGYLIDNWPRACIDRMAAAEGGELCDLPERYHDMLPLPEGVVAEPVPAAP